MKIDGKTCFELLMNNDQVKIIDVRSQEDYLAGHITHAINLDILQFGSYSQIKALDPNQTYLIYCNSGLRSSSILRILESLGFTLVYILNNGLQDWEWALEIE